MVKIKSKTEERKKIEKLEKIAKNNLNIYFPTNSKPNLGFGFFLNDQGKGFESYIWVNSKENYLSVDKKEGYEGALKLAKKYEKVTKEEWTLKKEYYDE